jgi:hypothetical protein
MPRQSRLADRVELLSTAALLVPVAEEGTWPGADESPAAPTEASFTVTSSVALLSVASLSTASFTVASSATLLSTASLSAATFVVASSVALLSAASLSITTFIATTTLGAAGTEPLDPPTSDDSRNHFCRGVSSSDDISSSSRTTRTCLYLPLPGAGAGLEPPAGPPTRPPAELLPVGAPPRLPPGPPPRSDHH